MDKIIKIKDYELRLGGQNVCLKIAQTISPKELGYFIDTDKNGNIKMKKKLRVKFIIES